MSLRQNLKSYIEMQFFMKFADEMTTNGTVLQLLNFKF